MSTQFHYLSIAELAAGYRGREFTPVEVTAAYLDRITAYQSAYEAYITVTADLAQAQAERATRDSEQGVDRGPLQGVPFGIKDIIHVKGVRTTAASKVTGEWTAEEDATCWSRLRGAGAVLLGKLNCHEFAWGATNINHNYPTTSNPWDPARITGGSSGGSGVAIAAGLAAGALGTDTGGSIRIPAALCGLVGLKGTYGRVSRHGVISLSWSLDNVGPMTRTVEDAALALQVLAGRDPLDPASSPEPVPDYGRGLATSLSGLRVGVPRGYFYEDLASDVEKAVADALQTLRDLGATTVDVEFPGIEHASTISRLIHVPEATAYHAEWLAERPDDYGADVRERLEWGKLIPAVDYLKAQQARRWVVDRFNRDLMSRVDVLVTPACPITAPRKDARSVVYQGREMDVRNLVAHLTRPFNLTGSPAIVLPCGFDREGLPVGLQIAGRPFEEVTVLRAAHAYERATPWHTRRPVP